MNATSKYRKLMGPITLFDKSFLEMLNVDQAVLFDALYSSVIAPIFYTEVLADLEKMVPGSRTPVVCSPKTGPVRLSESGYFRTLIRRRRNGPEAIYH